MYFDQEGLVEILSSKFIFSIWKLLFLSVWTVLKQILISQQKTLISLFAKKKNVGKEKYIEKLNKLSFLENYEELNCNLISMLF